MGCWKVMDLRLRLWLPWTVLVVTAFLSYGYYQFLDPENCSHLYFACTLNSFTLPSSTKNSSPPQPSPPLYNDTRRIAVCLVGGARMFELTGLTLRRHLLDPYPNADVFLHSPFDGDSHKFSLLAGSRNLRVAKIFTPVAIEETRVTNEVITSWGSPRGMQGLLQYFSLVEGCYGLVKQYEVRHQFKYDWIIRTRVDGYWNAPIPNITDLDPTRYYVAAGSDFNGLNDRFGMGNAHTSRAANARMSLLPLMYDRGFRGLNSESAYKAQLQISGVPHARIQVPFCIMTLRCEEFPPPPFGLLVLSMASRGPMSGTYCRPCDHEASRHTSKAIVDKCMRNWDWPGVAGSRVTVCNGSKPWASRWREVADAVYRKDARDAQGIPDFETPPRQLEDCLREMRAFQAGWDFWHAPPVEVICKRALTKS